MNPQKICLITGASSGIGHAIAKSLSMNGEYQLVITARREEKLKEIQSDNVDILPGDLNSTELHYATTTSCPDSQADDLAKRTQYLIHSNRRYHEQLRSVISRSGTDFPCVAG